MKHIIDINTWKRRDNYLFFQDALNAWVCITSEVDCTEAFEESKAVGRSFFVRYLYAILRAANEIEEYRYRTDSKQRVCLYDTIDVITPIAIPGKTFYTVRIPYIVDYEKFYQTARDIIEHVPQDGDPYYTDKLINEQGDYDVINLSATPKLYFTSVVYTQVEPGCGQHYPLMNAGKVVGRGDRLVMPVSITVSHEFVDGSHNARFFELVEKYLRKL